MGDEFDVDDMLEAAFYKSTDSSSKKNETGTNGHNIAKGLRLTNVFEDEDQDEDEDRDRGERKKKSRHRSRSRSRDRESKKGRRDRSRDRREKDRERRGSRDHRRSRSHERRDRDRDSRRRRSRSKDKVERVDRQVIRDHSATPPRLRLGPKRGRSSRSPLRLGGDTPLSPEERDARTVFCMQLSQRVRARDLEEFFSSVGKVRDVRMITCNKTRRFKGIAYIEFRDIDSVALALGLGGQKLLGVPIIVQPSQAEKNRAGQLAKAGAIAAVMATSTPGPMKLYVGSLHFNITEEMLRGIFEPFGRIDEIILMKDHETGRSKGFGFLTFHEGEDAKRAMEQLNGFEIAGRPMKVGYVTEKPEGGQYFHNPQTMLDSDEMDRAGVNLGVTGRLQLMAKLAEGTDLKLPASATSALNLQTQLNQNAFAAAQVAIANSSVPAAATGAPAISTQCFMLSNMFDPMKELGNAKFEADIRDEVLEACIPHGGAVHIYVDMNTPGGNVYVKCPSVNASAAAVNALHGRWFGGRVITAAYVPILNYHSLFTDSMAAQTVLQPSKK